MVRLYPTAEELGFRIPIVCMLLKITLQCDNVTKFLKHSETASKVRQCESELKILQRGVERLVHEDLKVDAMLWWNYQDGGEARNLRCLSWNAACEWYR